MSINYVFSYYIVLFVSRPTCLLCDCKPNNIFDQTVSLPPRGSGRATDIN